ncbi:MAG TPA: AtpZ/AtpI family protein [Saprospiraceae bacterium]|nr:AtpZ/AtpI family protein [Saprospiraceae bacterium]HQW94381.1 AtpZ/AtpI family protein [Saprospiraceae bacterium]
MSSSKLPDRKNSMTYLRYTGMGFQLIGVILISCYLGNYIDNRWNQGNPKYWTAGLMLVLTLGYLYKIIRDLTKNNQ